MSSLLTRLGLAVLAAGFTTLTALPTATAIPTPTTAPIASTPVMVILDASGSMTTADAPGPRIDAAKRAVTGLVANLPSYARVGLEVYGTSTGSSNAEKAAGCRDIKVVVPVGPIDKSAFDTQVGQLRASGYTPIGAALRKAAAALPREGPRSIVLVSDGEDTCAPPQPCDVAKELKAAGVDLVVHTVGFKVNDAARAQLSCIADATGGTYVDAPDGPSLSRQLQVRVARALKPYTAVGTPITGAPSAAGAPEIEPGQYLDTYDDAGSGLGGDGTTKYYTVMLQQGQTPYVSATIVPPAIRVESLTSLRVDIEMTDVGRSGGCDFDASDYDLAYRGRVNAVTAVLDPGAVGGSAWPSGCPTEGPFAVKVVRAGNAYAAQPVKMEVALRIEPPADATGLPAPIKAQPNIRVTPTGAVHDVTAGSSYNDAPLLVPGTYRDTVVSGETRYYKIHLQWGQRLAYVITPARLPGVGVLQGVNSTTYLANPLRARLDEADGAVSGAAFLGSTDSAMTGSTTVPVRYLNRSAIDTDVKKYGVDGDYYLVFSSGFPSASDPPLTIPYTMSVSVVGTPERGPVYQQESTSADGSSSAPSAATGTQPASPAASPVAGQRKDSSGISTPVLATGGAGVGVCALGATVWLIKRRRETSAAATRAMNTWPPTNGTNTW